MGEGDGKKEIHQGYSKEQIKCYSRKRLQTLHTLKYIHVYTHAYIYIHI